MKFDRVLDKSFPPYGNGTGGSDLKTDTMEFIPFKSFADFGFIKTSGPANPIEIIYKLRFKIRQPTLNSDSEIVIMKTVAIERPVQRGMRTFASPQLEEGHPGGTLLAEGEVAVPWGPAPPPAAANSRSGLLASPDG
jgi:hypothetical protein